MASLNRGKFYIVPSGKPFALVTGGLVAKIVF